jgi:hypothetical protein
MKGRSLVAGILLSLVLAVAAGTAQAASEGPTWTSPGASVCTQEVRGFVWMRMTNDRYQCREEGNRLFLFDLGRMLPAYDGIYSRPADGGRETFFVTKGGYVFNRQRH